jgi:hypothetical protein
VELPIVGVLAQRHHQQNLNNTFFLLTFSLDEKVTKNQDKNMLPRSRPMLARYRCIGMSTQRSPKN